MTDRELASTPAVDLVRMIATRTVSPVEVFRIGRVVEVAIPDALRRPPI
jgi:hypothetical protein